MTLNIGDHAPDFTLPATGGRDISLVDCNGRNLVLYFYPKDDTPGCTQQACDIRDNINALQNHGAVVLGVSKDGVASHEKFKQKFNLNYDLLADTQAELSRTYGAWGTKSMYGKSYEGIVRTTFLIDKQGVIRAIWRNVKVTEHLGDILNALNDLEPLEEAHD